MVSFGCLEALILRSDPTSAFTRVCDALWDRVSKDEGVRAVFAAMVRDAASSG
jgi:hypothetical protein